MKKGLKVLATGGILALGILSSNTIKAVSDLKFEPKIYTKYVVLTDEGKVTLPDTYHFDDGTKDGYNLNLLPLKNTVQNLADTFKDYVTYNSSTGEFTSKYGIQLDFGGSYNAILLKPDGSLITDTSNAVNKEYLVRIAKVTMLKNLWNKQIPILETYLNNASSEKEKNQYTTQIKNYREDLAAMENLNLNDIPKDKVGYNFVTTSSSRLSCVPQYDQNTWTHLGENITLSYYYYTVITRDLRLNSIKYKVNGASETPVSNFNKDTKTYNVQLPVNTPKNATITTTSKSYAIEEDSNRNWIYDSGISIEESTVTLNNGVGTGKVKVKFDAKPYGDNGNYVKEYTINYTIMQYQKGDVNKDGYINALDAAMVLDLYKNNNAVQDNYDYGDMNNDNQLNSTDAAMILDLFKNSNKVNN